VHAGSADALPASDECADVIRVRHARRVITTARNKTTLPRACLHLWELVDLAVSTVSEMRTLTQGVGDLLWLSDGSRPPLTLPVPGTTLAISHHG
jgi:hypothetical protein